MNLAKNDDPKLRFSSIAVLDIKATWQYVSERDEDAAEELIRQLIDKCRFLSFNRKAGRERSDLLVGMRQFPYKNYNIFYFGIDDGVEI